MRLHLRLGPLGTSRKEPFEALTDRVVALARRLLESDPICNPDRPTALADQAHPLERARDAAHGRALNPEHLGQGFMGERDVVLVGSVAGAQDGAAAPGFHAMNRIAGDGLEGLRQKGFRVTEKNASCFWALFKSIAQAIQSDTRCCSGNLGDVTSEGLAGDERAHEAEYGLPAEHGHFDGAAIPQDSDQGNDGVMGKIGVMERLAGLIDDFAPRQVYDFEMRFEPQIIIWLQSSEELVPPMSGGLRTILHGRVSPRCRSPGKRPGTSVG